MTYTTPARTVYLAGPITHLSYEEARNGWRRRMTQLLSPHIHPLSPMRGKDCLIGTQKIDGAPDAYDNVHPMATASGILARDFNDVKTCDAVIANFLNATKASIGTCVEFGFAYALRKPVIMIIEKDGLVSSRGSSYTKSTHIAARPDPLAVEANPHAHAFLTEIAGYRVHSLEAAALLANSLLTPGV